MHPDMHPNARILALGNDRRPPRTRDNGYSVCRAAKFAKY